MPRPSVRTNGNSIFNKILGGGCADWPAVIYTRRSDEDQSAYSPEFQERMARNLCETYRLSVKAVYFDDDLTGGNTQRPQFQLMLTEARARRFQILVVPRVDRFSRDVIDCLQTIDQLHALDLTVLSANELVDFKTPMGRKFLTDQASNAEWYRNNLSAVVRENLRGKAQRGLFNGRPPFGYLRRHNHKPNGERIKGTDRLEATPDLEVVREMGRIYRTGESSDARIAEQLNRQGFTHRNPVTGARQLFTKDTIQDILTNPVYTGKVSNGGVWYDGLHEPAFSDSEWSQMQAIRQSRRHSHYGSANSRGDGNLLSGLARCAKCGAIMNTHMQGEGSYRQPAYWCSTRRRLGRDGCDTRSVNGAAIHAEIRTLLSLLNLPQEVRARAIEQALQQAPKAHQAFQPVPEAALQALKKRFMNDEITAAEYERQRASLLDTTPQATPTVEPVFDVEQAWQLLDCRCSSMGER